MQMVCSSSRINYPHRNNATVLTGINEHGEIVGYCRERNGVAIHGFLLTGGPQGTYKSIDVRPGWETYVYGINNLGDFAGEISGAGETHGFVNIGGIVTQIDVPGAASTRATAVAWDGTVVGRYYTSSGGDLGFLRGPKGKFLRFKVANATFTAPMGINNEAGQIVGWYRDTSDVVHGFVYDYVADLTALANGTEPAVRTVPVRTVDFPGAGHTEISGINATGVIVGSAYGPGAAFGFTGTPK